jgi:D-arabinose 1-dehydrogenase-like Zn-dependent alcohol dehydrogenase
MKAAVLRKLSNIEANPEPLTLEDLPAPVPEAGQILVRVSACGVCHTEIDEIESRTPPLRAVHEDFAYPIPEVFSDVQAAPLLCAGAIGYRSLRLAGLRDGDNLGLTGFGASAKAADPLFLGPRDRGAGWV